MITTTKILDSGPSKNKKALLLAGCLFLAMTEQVYGGVSPQTPVKGHATEKTKPGDPKNPRPQTDSPSEETQSPQGEAQEKPDLTEALKTEESTDKFLKDHEAVAKALEDIDLDSKDLQYNDLEKALKAAGVENPTDEQLQSLLSHYVSQKALEGSETHSAFIQKMLDGARGKEAGKLSPLEQKLNERGLALREELVKNNPALRTALDKLSHQSQSAQGFQLRAIENGLKKDKGSDEYKRAVTQLSQWVTPLSPSSRAEMVKAAEGAQSGSLSSILKTAIESRSQKGKSGELATAATSDTAVDSSALRSANEAEAQRTKKFADAVKSAKSFDELTKTLDEGKIADTKALVEWAAATDSGGANGPLARKIIELAAVKNQNTVELRSPTIGDSQGPSQIKVSGGSVDDTAAAVRTLASGKSFSEVKKQVQDQNKTFHSSGISKTSSSSSLSYYGKEHAMSLQYEGTQLLKSPPSAPESDRAKKGLSEKFQRYLREVKGADGKPSLGPENLKRFFKSGDFFEGNTDQEAVAYGKQVDQLSQQQLLSLFNRFMADSAGQFNYCPSCWAVPGGNFEKIFPKRP